jgi:adenine phosphoribosyltransferase
MGDSNLSIENALSLIRVIPDYPHKGILFQDITPVLANPAALKRVISELAFDNREFSHVAGIEARGFILASALALEIGAGFVPLRKGGKLPAAVFSRQYSLEYGVATLEIHQDALSSSHKVLLIDDVLATGGTIIAALQLIHDAGGTVDDVHVLMEITGLGGRAKIAELFPKVTIRSLVQV